MFQGDLEAVSTAARQALAVSPNFARAHHLLGLVLLSSGRPKEALESFLTAERLDPHDPSQITRLYQIGLAHYFLRDYDTAVEVEKQALRSYPDHPWAYLWLTAALGQAGRLDEAKQALERLIAVAPKSIDMYVRQRLPWWRVEEYEHVLEGLRKAGWKG